MTKSGTLPGKGDYSSMTYISKLGLFTAGEVNLHCHGLKYFTRHHYFRMVYYTVLM